MRIDKEEGLDGSNPATLELTVTVSVCAKWELRSQKVLNRAHKALLVLQQNLDKF